MKKFTFRLERLLEIRQKKEDEQKAELARASGAYQFEVQKREKIKESVKNRRGQLPTGEGKLNALSLRDFDRYATASEIAMNSLEGVIEEKKTVMEKEAARFAELKKDRRAVEIIKEKALARYHETEKKEEQESLDEIGTNMFREKQSAGNASKGRKS